MAYTPPNPNAQATMANSSPVVIASNQSSIPVTLTNGTTTADTLAGDTGQNSQLVAGTRKETTFTTTTVQAVAVTDVSNFRSVSVHITSQGTGSSVSFQTSNDNVNWAGTNLSQSSGTAAATIGSSSTTGIWYGPIIARYFRLNVTGISAGTTAGVVQFSSLPTSIHTFGVAAAQTGTWTVQPGNTANTTPWLVTQVPLTTGGLATYHLVSAATTNAVVVKASAGQVFGWYIYNSNAAARKLIFHNAATAPTAGAAVLFSLVIPPTSGANVSMDSGITFSTGIAITTTTGLADADAVAVALNDLVINIFFK